MIAILDCAMEKPALFCFNNLVNHFKLPFSYHHIPSDNTDEIKKYNPKAIIVFGSSSNVKDEHPWQLELKEYIFSKLKEGTPVLGICFGHQLMAHFFGATVELNPKTALNNLALRGQREIDLFDHAFFQGQKKLKLIIDHSYQVFNPPKELKILASSTDCPLEVLIHEKYPWVGIQGHPEASWNFVLENLENTVAPNHFREIQKDGLLFIKLFLEYFAIIEQDQLQHQSPCCQ